MGCGRGLRRIGVSQPRSYDRPQMRLNHVTLDVHDVEASARFYVSLGLVPIVLDYPDYARLSSPEETVTLSLQRASVGGRGGRASVHLEVDDVDAAVNDLQRRGLSFVRAPADQPYLWREAVLLDPDGYEVFVYHAGKNRLNPPWRVSTPN